MNPVRSHMHRDVICLGQSATVTTAARQMRQHGIGSQAVYDGQDKDHPIGLVTDRDIVMMCLAEGYDPDSWAAGDPFEGTMLRSIVIDSDAQTVMQRYRIRRLPVTEQGRLVGILTETDIARALPDETVGRFVDTVSEAPSQSGRAPAAPEHDSL
ncbi:CBS domain-containing protein [Nocardia sp. X0981]